MAVIWVGGGLMMQLFAVRASIAGDPARMAHLGEDIGWIAQRTFIPASLLAFVSGILLVVESDFYGFGDDWIVIGLVLYDMAVKPDFGDASSLLWGLAGAAVAAGLVVWRHRVAVGRPSPAPSS